MTGQILRRAEHEHRFLQLGLKHNIVFLFRVTLCYFVLPYLVLLFAGVSAENLRLMKTRTSETQSKLLTSINKCLHDTERKDTKTNDEGSKKSRLQDGQRVIQDIQ